MDVKENFLNGNLTKEVYMEQPKGFCVISKEDHVYRLRKTLYGLKQAPKAWYSKLDAHLREQGFSKGAIDRNLYFKTQGDSILVVIVVVDDIIFGSDSSELCSSFLEIVKCKFEMSMLGELSFFLGLQVNQLDKGIFISQTKYAKEMLAKFKMLDCKPVGTPMEIGCKLCQEVHQLDVDHTLYRYMIGSLLYLDATRPDIMHFVCLASQFQSSPKQSHLNAVKRILKYIAGTLDFGLWYSKHDDFTHVAYTDADWAGNLDDRKSTSSGAFYLGGRLVA